ncbi:HlyD family secretion protein [Prochlorococcus sp. MIT 1306]|uniref:HlyD family secretion protein n=1 Tax=Prochlorococcus sp. MIT 1306 TaxID=1799667 RepID=UPI0007BB57F8|nr:biotin/lipoyl-binding protein [Prochlorococcus sp. MIT 1306]KZR65035.1 p-hydroxybenzoic acid efflux pump subunit AaeA [Prochlorococcus sp. MIT 1306]
MLWNKSNKQWLQAISSSPLYIVIIIVSGLTTIVLAWAILYRIKPTSSGVGLTVKRGIVNRVYTPIEGRVQSVLVDLGQEVRKGQVIALIDNTREKIDFNNKEQIANVSGDLTPSQILSQSLSTKKQIKAINDSMTTLINQISVNNDLLNRMQTLLNTGDISDAEYLQQLKAVDDLKIQLLSLRGKKSSLQSSLYRLTISARSDQINDIQNSQLANYNLELSKKIVATIDGIVTLIDVTEGDFLKEGDTVAQISYKTGAVKGVFVMSGDMAKRVKPGDQCLVSPAESPPERYGYIKGTADSIGILPTNPDEYRRRIGLDYTTKQLFQELTNNGKGESLFKAFPYIVIVNINMKDGKPSWTTGKNPPWGFMPGAAAQVQCVYNQWSPIQYIIPFLRREAGYVRVS